MQPIQPVLRRVIRRRSGSRAEHLLALAAILAIWMPGHAARSELIEGFEGPTTSWNITGGDCRPQIELHRRTARHARSGARCEHIRIRAEAGTHIYATHAIEPSVVIKELLPTVWIRSDRTGIQLLARVVLPRSTDPRGDRPLTTLIRGSLYQQAGSWQRLQIRDPLALLSRKVPVLRAQFGPQIDSREAYVDMLVLNLYGGLGVTNVWIDDLKLANGTFTAGGARLELPGARSPAQLRSAASRTHNRPRRAAPRVRFQRSQLTVDGRPRFIRAIQYQGEPLAWLAKLGFDAVQLAAAPTRAQLAEADELGLWLIAPAASQRELGMTDKRILAWDLGRGLDLSQLGRVRDEVARIRRGSDQPRPLICSADTGLYAYSRQADILLHERLPLGTSFALADFPAWLAQRSRLARPGTPFWAVVQTEPNPQVAGQHRALDPRGQIAVYTDPEQLRLLTLLAVTGGARGVCFRSGSPLDGNSPPTRLRARALQCINHELSMIEPWIAEGASLTYVDCSSPEVTAAALATERSTLIIPIRLAPGSQYAVELQQNEPVALTVPGASESNRAFELTTTALEPLRHRQVAGGMRVVLDNVSPASLVVLTQDPLAVQGLSRRATSSAEHLIRVRRELAASVLAAVEGTERGLSGAAPPEPRADAFLRQARASLRQCDRFLLAKDPSTADHYVMNCLITLAGLRRLRWSQAVSGQTDVVASPFCVSYASLPWHWRFIRQAANAANRPNLLPAGDFESLDQMVKTGWRHFRHAPPEIATEVSLTARDPRAGQYALSMRVERKTGSSNVPLETTPLWVNSAPIRVQAGQWVRVRGWARVVKPIRGSLDGLMVFDSLGGPLLAKRLRKTGAWEQFTLYRGAPRPTELIVTFALTGTGEVNLDQLSVELLPRT